MNKYSGYIIFDYKDKDNYTVEFKTSNYQTVSI